MIFLIQIYSFIPIWMNFLKTWSSKQEKGDCPHKISNYPHPPLSLKADYWYLTLKIEEKYWVVDTYHILKTLFQSIHNPGQRQILQQVFIKSEGIQNTHLPSLLGILCNNHPCNTSWGLQARLVLCWRHWIGCTFCLR